MSVVVGDLPNAPAAAPVPSDGSVIGKIGSKAVYMIPGAVKGAIVLGANVYAGVIEGSMYAAIGTGECLASGASAACEVWKTGLRGTLKEAAKERLGINDFAKVGTTLTTSVVTVKKGPGKGQQVRMPLPKRIGTAVGHVGKGAGKVALTAAGTGMGLAWAVGTATQTELLKVSADSGTALAGAQSIATGINTIVQVSYGAAATVAPYALSAAQAGLSLLGKGAALAFDGPATALQVGGSAALLYGAAKEVQNASASEGKIAQVFHGSMAALLAVSAVCVSPLVSSLC